MHPPPISTLDTFMPTVHVFTRAHFKCHFVARAVTLAGNANEMFRGFLVVAMSGSQRVGNFAPDANGQVACDVSMHTCCSQ